MGQCVQSVQRFRRHSARGQEGLTEEFTFPGHLPFRHFLTLKRLGDLGVQIPADDTAENDRQHAPDADRHESAEFECRMIEDQRGSEEAEENVDRQIGPDRARLPGERRDVSVRHTSQRRS